MMSVMTGAGVLEPHGYERVNDAGKEMLFFLSCHQATICNTYFKKKDTQKQTWQHLISLLYRFYCYEPVAQALFIAWIIDHHLVCAKLLSKDTHYRNRSRSH